MPREGSGYTHASYESWREGDEKTGKGGSYWRDESPEVPLGKKRKRREYEERERGGRETAEKKRASVFRGRYRYANEEQARRGRKEEKSEVDAEKRRGER